MFVCFCTNDASVTHCVSSVFSHFQPRTPVLFPPDQTPQTLSLLIFFHSSENIFVARQLLDALQRVKKRLEDVNRSLQNYCSHDRHVTCVSVEDLTTVFLSVCFLRQWTEHLPGASRRHGVRRRQQEVGPGRRLHGLQQGPHLPPHGQQRLPSGGPQDPGPSGQWGQGGTKSGSLNTLLNVEPSKNVPANSCHTRQLLLS